MKAAERYIVTVTGKDGVPKSQFWNSKDPFKLGYPSKWQLEKQNSGTIHLLRVQHSSKGAQTKLAAEITPAAVSSGSKVKLPQFALQVFKAAEVRPAFLPPLQPEAKTSKARAYLYTAVDAWNLEAQEIKSGYLAQYHHHPALAFKRLPHGFKIKALTSGIQIWQGEQVVREVHTGEMLELNYEEITSTIFKKESTTWSVALVEDQGPLAPAFEEATDDEASLFYKTTALVLLICIAVGTWIYHWDFTPAEPEEPEGPVATLAYQQPKVIPKPMAVVPPPSPKIVTAPPKIEEPIKVVKKVEKSVKIAQKNVPHKTPFIQQRTPNPVKNPPVNANLLKAQNIANNLSSKLGSLVQDPNSLLQKTNINAPKTAQVLQGAPPIKPNIINPDLPTSPLNVQTLGGDPTTSGAGFGKGPGVGYASGEPAKIGGKKGNFQLGQGVGEVEEGLTKEEVESVIAQSQSKIRSCYENALLRQPGLSGRLGVAFKIDGSGSVVPGGTKVTENTLKGGGAGLDQCILKIVPSWKFPKPKGGVTVNASYPFVFQTLN